MTFAADLAAILEDGLAVDAVYRAQGGPDVPVRVIKRAPDDTATWSNTVLGTDTTLLTVAVADVTAPAEGDVFEIDGALYAVQGSPARDARGLRWTVQAIRSS